jgi:50S ribosomal subunit-associated GTPase HflX
MLFATLETSVRTIDTGDNKPFFLVDTVGFIDRLPHGLVKAFRSTLEEVKYADLLLHVVDFSDENYRQQMEVTEQTLKELEAGDIPRIVVYNKADLITDKQDDKLYVSALTGEGIDLLKTTLVDLCKPVKKEKPFPNEPALVFALFGAFIFTKSVRKSLIDSMSNVNAAVAADAYLDERSFELEDSNDTYMYSNVVAVPRPRGNGHHGGGSGGHGGGGGGY